MSDSGADRDRKHSKKHLTNRDLWRKIRYGFRLNEAPIFDILRSNEVKGGVCASVKRREIQKCVSFERNNGGDRWIL